MTWALNDMVGVPITGLGRGAANRGEGATEGCVVTEVCAGMAGADPGQD